MDKSWASQNARAHDSPLTSAGLLQASAAGKHISRRLRRANFSGQLTVYVSPLLRTAHTAKAILEQLTQHFPMSSVRVRVEQGICENPLRLRLRLLGIHKYAGGEHGEVDGTLLPSGEKRTVENCSPVLLSVEDVRKVLLPYELDSSYESQVKVQYDKECFELDDESGDKTTVQARVGKCLARLRQTEDWKESPQVSIFVSHGGCVKAAVEALLGRRVLLLPSDITYCHTFELINRRGLGWSWDCVGEWQHPSVLTLSARLGRFNRACDGYIMSYYQWVKYYVLGGELRALR